MEFLTRKAGFLVLMAFSCGCSLMPHALHPSQLWKMNRQQPWDEGSLSVADPVDPRLAELKIAEGVVAPASESAAR